MLNGPRLRGGEAERSVAARLAYRAALRRALPPSKWLPQEEVAQGHFALGPVIFPRSGPKANTSLWAWHN